ncbi:MAG TPA: S49 family peptidase, partial [Verrucomicrobiae bacterium]|nr:S49 family peptidase [Verrucomicrobiae bacterium]
MGMQHLKKIIGRVLATVGALVLVGIILGLGCVLIGRKSIPSKVILEADFETHLVEYVPDDPVAKIVSGKAPTVLGVVEALDRASTDKHVVGLVARVGEAGLSLAEIQEIRDAVIAFRHSGKPAIAYAETFGEDNRGNGSYYLASAFDEICLQPSGDVGLAGVMFETPFLRGTL